MCPRARATNADSPEKSLIAARALDEICANVAVIDRDGVILVTNRGWRDFASHNRLPNGTLPNRVEVGNNYLDVCRFADGASSENSVAIFDGIRAVLDSKQQQFSHEYPCHGPTRKRWFLMTVRPIRYSRPRLVVITHFDITDRRLAEMESAARQKELAAALDQFQQMASYIKDFVATPTQPTIAPPLSSRVKPGTAGLPLTLDDRLALLSTRELEIFWALVRGERNATIADRLRLSKKSVSTYRARMMEKLKVQSNADLVTLLYVDGSIHRLSRELDSNPTKD